MQPKTQEPQGFFYTKFHKQSVWGVQGTTLSELFEQTELVSSITPLPVNFHEIPGKTPLNHHHFVVCYNHIQSKLVNHHQIKTNLW